MGQQQPEQDRQRPESRLPKAVAATGLTDLEIKLLLCLQKTLHGPSAVFSISELAKTLDAPSGDVISSMTSLEKKGYLRHWRLFKGLPAESSEPKELAKSALEHTIETLTKIEKLSSLRESTPEGVYDRVLGDLLDELTYSARRLAEARRAGSTVPRRMQAMIEAEKAKLAEIRLRMAIGQIDPSEGARLVESYENEIHRLEAQVQDAAYLPSEKGHESIARQTELEDRLTGISENLEELWVRCKIGEITETQRAQQSCKLEEEKQSIVAELRLLEDKPRVALTNIEKKVRDLADAKILPERITARLLTEIDQLRASMSPGDA